MLQFLGRDFSWGYIFLKFSRWSVAPKRLKPTAVGSLNQTSIQDITSIQSFFTLTDINSSYGEVQVRCKDYYGIRTDAPLYGSLHVS